MVVVLLVALMGFTAFAVDLGRVYAFKAQLQTTADAAAMAGAVELMRDLPEQAPTAAVDYAGRNLVETHAAFVPTDSVIPGTWVDTAFVPLSSWTDPAVNAVQVRANYQANYMFAPVIGNTFKNISAVAVGAVGSISGSGCVKPWAVPYQNLLWAMGKPYTTAEDLAYNMTAADAAALRASTIENNIVFKIDAHGDQAEVVATGATLPGSYYAVRFAPIEFADGTDNSANVESGAAPYEEHINSCSSSLVSIGDWLQAENGNMVGPTRQGIEVLCGGLTSEGDCITPAAVQAPIYAELRESGLPQFKIKYIGGFVVTKYKAGAVYGYFDGFPARGQWSSAPGPLTNVAMVR